MTESKKPMAKDLRDIKDDAPDLTESPWAEKLAAAPVVRGRPKSEQTKVSTTIRLDADVLEGFRSDGPGWQSRINDVLRAWLAKR
ncbi:uncharacterized protein (DUF4415 family) [Neorhizobium galegae]|uniref:BrnA antitoxin family protein n=1 Tax=Neorhizobium galegae TaxID=399 RepID=UPI001ECD4624|nr:BrnA antitoxin family protein [Neorhizobium galegae]MBP2560426.1 uncharacterized protein (DUF4415 family) [Neorhizobium galegae]